MDNLSSYHQDGNGDWLPFQEARDYVRAQGLLSWQDWQNWSKTERPKNIPAIPKKVYKDQWIDFTDWTEYPSTEESIVPLPMRRAIKRRMREKPPAMLSYALAKKMIQRIAEDENWESFTDVYNWLRSPERPEYFPHTPQEFYGDWWKGWADFVGPDLAPPSQTRGPGFVGADSYQQFGMRPSQPIYAEVTNDWDEDIAYGEGVVHYASENVRNWADMQRIDSAIIGRICNESILQLLGGWNL